jgi:cytochrome c-type biogenesis protein
VAGLFFWLTSALLPMEAAERALLTLMIMVLPLTGAGLSARGALVVGVLAAALNTAAWAASPLAGIYTTAEWVGFAVQALLIVLVVTFISRTDLFYMDRHMEVSDRLQNRGYLTSGIMGAVFGAGWTPCTGPNLAIILAMAAAASTVATGAALLSTYALGLGIPFLMVGLFFGYATRMLRRMMPYMSWIKAINAGLLLLIAVLILSGSLQLLAGYGGFLPGVDL